MSLLPSASEPPVAQREKMQKKNQAPNWSWHCMHTAGSNMDLPQIFSLHRIWFFFTNQGSQNFFVAGLVGVCSWTSNVPIDLPSGASKDIWRPQKEQLCTGLHKFMQIQLWSSSRTSCDDTAKVSEDFCRTFFSLIDCRVMMTCCKRVAEHAHLWYAKFKSFVAKSTSFVHHYVLLYRFVRCLL